MKHGIKSQFTALLMLSTLTLGSLSFSPSANAGFAFILPLPFFILPAFIVGSSVGAAGLKMMSTGFATRQHGVKWAKLALFLTGVLTLDQENGLVKLHEINKTKAAKLGIDEYERDSYNRDIDKVNLVYQTITERLALYKTEKNAQQFVNCAKEISEDELKVLSPETQQAFRKVMKHFVNATEQRS